MDTVEKMMGFEETDANEKENGQKLTDANILVAGITGTGKSTLLNAVFGEEVAKTGTGKPVTEHLDEYKNPKVPIHIWDTVGLELDSEKTNKSINDIKNTIAARGKLENKYDCIHAIWYCINSGSNRYQGAELEFIKSLHETGVPFIIVLTQCTDLQEKIDAFAKVIDEENKKRGMLDIDIIQVCAKDFQTRLGVIPAFGLEELVDTTISKMPEYISKGFIAAQQVSKQQKRKKCEEIIVPFIKDAATGVIDKIPFVNIISTNIKLKDLLGKIIEMYNDMLPKEALDEIIRNSHIEFPDVWQNLINPLNSNYVDQINRLFMEKIKDGFEEDYLKLSEKGRAARMIAYYGFIYIDSVEKVWDKIRDKELEELDEIGIQLAAEIKLHLERGREQKGKA